MKKIDIEKALKYPNIVKDLSEFTVDMMSNIEVTKCLREAFVQDTDLETSSKKLIQAIESYKKNLLKKSRRVTISTDKDTKFIDLYEGTHPFERGALVFYVDIINSKLISAIVNTVTTHETDRPTYLINYYDDHGMNTTRECEEYSLRSRALDEDEKTPVAEQTKLWLSEVSWQKENHHINNKLSKLEEAIKKTEMEITKTDEPSVREQLITQLNDFKKLKNKLLIDRQQIADELKRKREIIYSKKAVAAKSDRSSNRSKWSLYDIKPSTGGRNRRTKKAHYYSKRRRTRHYRSKRVRSK